MLVRGRRNGFGSGKYLASGLDADGSAAAGGAHEFLDAPAGSVLDQVADPTDRHYLYL